MNLRDLLDSSPAVPPAPAQLPDDPSQQGGAWFDVFAKLSAHIGGLSRQIARRNQLDQWAREVPYMRFPVSVLLTSGTVNVVTSTLWTPPEGYWWKVRQVIIAGPKAANGTELAITTVNADLYVTGAGLATPNAVPSSGDWMGSSGTSAAPGGVPFAFHPGDKAISIQNGDQFVVVLSGAGVSNTPFIVTLMVTQFQGLAGMTGSETGD